MGKSKKTMADEKEDFNKSKELLSELNSFISSSNYVGVLKAVAGSPPNCKDASLQKEIADPVIKALSKLKRTGMNECLKQMEPEQREVVLQYVYYGFQAMPKSATEFLNWQQAIVKLDGIGAICRVVTNIKRNILVSADDTTQ